ncbi:pyridoxal phosphate-dependent transferase [Thermothelomyces heterothallicus CBS 202.75]|uniref:pyridoxal phosphate-dependent transferase n=1 Tax=Thermothelomyces heterothallicus CBS 202.75 TaxID=1149848 RepID=UPI0037434B5F
MDAEYQSLIDAFRAGQKKPEFPSNFDSREYARQLDAQDKLSYLRDRFIIPTKGSLRKKALTGTLPGEHERVGTLDGEGKGTEQNGSKNGSSNAEDGVPAIYFVGNSLGAQPKSIRTHLDAQLETWASIGVNGHFTSLDNSPLTAWQDMAADCARKSVDLVGAASPSEVIYMNTLTVNLHLMMASFYRPTEKRHKIIVEWKPFPSDYYAITSQLEWHGLNPSTSLVEIHPDDPETQYMSTAHILSVIDEHADGTALLLLPGIQYYTGQLLDVARITAHARARGIPAVGWDLAHAVGNVELALHDWGVDFAVWCTYKYLNAGPGAIAGAFVHQRHHRLRQEEDDGEGGADDHDTDTAGCSDNSANNNNDKNKNDHGDRPSGPRYVPRLCGWYGAAKATRFDMAKEFRPAEGAHGWQVSNPSAADLACVGAALGLFERAGMRALRDKAVVLTGYLERLLLDLLDRGGVTGRGNEAGEPPFRILTPADPRERGSQLSLLLRPGLLERVSGRLAEAGVVVDVRKPDVMRVAPVPMYCRFEDVWIFVRELEKALARAIMENTQTK